MIFVRVYSQYLSANVWMYKWYCNNFNKLTGLSSYTFYAPPKSDVQTLRQRRDQTCQRQASMAHARYTSYTRCLTDTRWSSQGNCVIYRNFSAFMGKTFWWHFWPLFSCGFAKTRGGRRDRVIFVQTLHSRLTNWQLWTVSNAPYHICHQEPLFNWNKNDECLGTIGIYIPLPSIY